ncbi:MAG TPA: nucleoside monophosphate kinase [Candidatus Paceibacterota bacterium]|nr:nucleoside monophosphate kinase [Candidatus Paceibacterota bacterium]
MFEQPLVTFFIGQSGCGKGTQADLLENRLKELDPPRKMFRLETGDTFREFITGSSYTARLTKQLMDHGKLVPPFLAVHVWSHLLIEGYQGDQHVLFDGTPRVFAEVAALDSAIHFYNWRPHVIFLNVSDGWARKRLGERQRADDQEASDVEERLHWFHTSVIPVIQYLQTTPPYIFHEINGEQAIEQVHADIKKALNI